jgi:hypothetical protein
MKLLERLSTLAVLLAAVIVIAVTVRDRLIPGNNPHQDAARAAQQLVGKPFPVPVGYQIGKTATLLLVVSSTCHFCSESMPFYRQLAAIQPKTSGELGLLAVVPESSEAGLEYLSKNGVRVAEAISTPSLSKVGLAATPTLVLLDRDRRVMEVWVGMLDASRQGNVLKRLREMCERCSV